MPSDLRFYRVLDRYRPVNYDTAGGGARGGGAQSRHPAAPRTFSSRVVGHTAVTIQDSVKPQVRRHASPGLRRPIHPFRAERGWTPAAIQDMVGGPLDRSVRTGACAPTDQ